MSLKQVFEAWVRLNQKSQAWRGVLCDAGLSIDAHTPDAFLAALRRRIIINRDAPGFEDFALDGDRGVQGGDPGRSLLYHAFAGTGLSEYRGQNLEDFPTLDEIIALENLIFGEAKATLKSLTEKARQLSHPEAPELGVVVFSYDYVSAARTPHRKSADLCFSRTGLARAGTDREYYSPQDRGWFTFTPDDAPFTIRAIPARYAAFLAVRLAGDPSRFGPKYFLHTNLDEIGDQERQFWVPLHKLFSGPDCIADCPNLKVRFEAEHVNEKIRRIHLELARRKMAALEGSQLEHYPFRFSTNLATLQIRGDSALIVPSAQPLVQEAKLNDDLLTFGMPADPSLFLTTLRIRPHDNTHYPCPKWVNCRTEVVDGKKVDLNQDPQLLARVHQGGYQALHYVDSTADGYLKAIVSGCALLEAVASVPAYSIIAQPDFLPFVSQADLFDWWREMCPQELKPYAWGDGPDPTPLYVSRMSANFDTHQVFQPFKTDDTVTAIVTLPRECRGFIHQVDPELDEPIPNSYLPDDGSGDFAPGWDITINKTDRVEHLAAYGLSSPFPEDARLCAAFGSTWPAAAPDITNWFPPDQYSVVVPLGNQAAGWDGTILPFTPFLSGTLSDYPNPAYSDWVQTLVDRKLDLTRLKDITLKKYTIRLMVVSRLFKVLQAKNDDDRARYGIVYFSPRAKDDASLNIAVKQSKAIHFDLERAFEVHYFLELGRSANPHAFTRLTLTAAETRKAFVSPDSVLIPDVEGNWTQKS